MNAVAERPPTTELAAFNGASAGSLLLSEMAMARIERVAGLMASGKTTVPQHLRGNEGDCFAITLQAMQWGMNPFAVAQKTHLVNGTLGYEAQLVAAVINNSGIAKDRFHFEWFGAWEKIVGRFKEVESKTKKDDNGYPKKYIVPDWKQQDEVGLGVRVWATIKGEATARVLELLMTQARTRNSTLWTEDPKQQIAYLAQKRWARLHAPDVILGVYTPDELAEPGEKFMGAAEVVEPPPPQPSYDQAKFDANFEQWSKVIRSGRKIAEDFIHFAATRGEPYTAEQIAKLKAVKADPATAATDAQPKEAQAPSPAAPAPAHAAPTKTYAEVAALINSAETQEDLNALDEHLGAVADAQHRAELASLIELRRNELPPF